MGPLGQVFEEYLYRHIVIIDVTPQRMGKYWLDNQA